MAAETFTYTPKKLIAGSEPDIITIPGTLLSGQNLAAGTLVESDTAGKWKVHSGIDGTSKEPLKKVAGVLVYATDATSADTNAVVYVAGNFFADQLTFPAAVNTNLLKAKFVEGSNIVLTFQATGEV
jgi:hypothetical protein